MGISRSKTMFWEIQSGNRAQDRLERKRQAFIVTASHSLRAQCLTDTLQSSSQPCAVSSTIYIYYPFYRPGTSRGIKNLAQNHTASYHAAGQHLTPRLSAAPEPISLSTVLSCLPIDKAETMKTRIRNQSDQRKDLTINPNIPCQ